MRAHQSTGSWIGSPKTLYQASPSQYSTIGSPDDAMASNSVTIAGGEVLLSCQHKVVIRATSALSPGDDRRSVIRTVGGSQSRSGALPSPGTACAGQRVSSYLKRSAWDGMATAQY